MVSRITPVTIKQDGDYLIDGGRSAHLAEVTGNVLGGFYIWNRLIADFVQAIWRGDVAHRSVPHLPTLTDGLRSEEIIAASDASGCWVAV